jgi:ketosteroid isomerase-like protein
MSQENVGTVREVVALVNEALEGNPSQRLTALVAADAEIDMSRRVFNPGMYCGHEGLRRLLNEIQEVWEEFHITAERFVDAGDRVVVIETRLGRGRGSGLEVKDRSATMWTLRDGQVIHMQSDLDPREALKAVGLEE